MSIPATADGLELAAAIRRGDFSAEELLERVGSRIDAVNPAIRAVVARWEADQAFDPKGPFAGVPLLLKDLLAEVRGTPLTMGSALLRGHICARESAIVGRLRAAGLRPIGRTSVPEFGFLPVTEPRLHGPCRNPWDLERTPGGSSGGAAAAVAAGIVPFAHGTDAGGSLRVPAACCGLFALKPSRGRVAVGTGQEDVLGGMTSEHVISWSVRDSAAVLGATSVSPPPRSLLEVVARDPPPLRIGMMTGAGGFGPVRAECVTAVHEVATLCEALGHEVVAADGAFARAIDLAAFFAALGDFVAHAVHRTVEGLAVELGRRVTAEEVEARTWAVAERGARLDARAMLRAVLLLEATGQALACLFDETGAAVLLTPTLSAPPPRIGHFDAIAPTDVAAFFHAKASLVTFPPLFNVGGQPAMSVPLVWSEEGLPIGTQFAAPIGKDELLLALAGQLERARPWGERRPPLFVSG